MRHAQTWDELGAVVDAASYTDDTIFALERDDESNYALLNVFIHAPNSYREDRADRYTRHEFVVPVATYDRANWIRWVFERVKSAAIHEACEWFMVDGERVYPPTTATAKIPTSSGTSPRRPGLRKRPATPDAYGWSRPRAISARIASRKWRHARHSRSIINCGVVHRVSDRHSSARSGTHHRNSHLKMTPEPISGRRPAAAIRSAPTTSRMTQHAARTTHRGPADPDSGASSSSATGPRTSRSPTHPAAPRAPTTRAPHAAPNRTPTPGPTRARP